MVLPLIVVTPSVCPHSLLYARLHQPLTRGPSLLSAACCPAPLLILSNQRAATLLLHSVDSQSGTLFSTDVCFDLIHKIFKLVFKLRLNMFTVGLDQPFADLHPQHSTQISLGDLGALFQMMTDGFSSGSLFLACSVPKLSNFFFFFNFG